MCIRDSICGHRAQHHGIAAKVRDLKARIFQQRAVIQQGLLFLLSLIHILLMIDVNLTHDSTGLGQIGQNGLVGSPHALTLSLIHI